jgi:hypothetical protein
LHKSPNLLVDLDGGRLAEIPMLGDLASEKDLFFLLRGLNSIFRKF